MFYISFLLIKIFLLVVITFLVTKSLTEKTKQLKMAEEDFTDKDYDATIEELPEVPPKIPDAHLDKLKKEFLALDINGDGDIQTSEMESMLMQEKIKLRMSEKEVRTLVKELDRDGDGTIDVAEFLDTVGSGSKRDVIHKALVKRSGIRKAFEKYDKDGNGYITNDEFRKVVEDKYSATLSSKEIKKLMKAADTNGDGKICYEEFLKAFTYFKPKGALV